MRGLCLQVPYSVSQTLMAQIISRVADVSLSALNGKVSKFRQCVTVEVLLFVVERRRRDKINTWISHLAELVPECSSDIKLTEVSRVQLAIDLLSVFSRWPAIELLCVLNALIRF